MYHLVFEINFQIHSVSLISLVSIHLLVHLSTHLSHHRHSHHPPLLYSFIPGSKPIFSTNPSHVRVTVTVTTVTCSAPPTIRPMAHSRVHTVFLDFFYLLDWTAFMIMGLDRTYHAQHFIFNFTLYFFVYSVW